MKKRSKRLLWVVYAIFFFYNLHVAFGLYINSSFLGSGCGCGIDEHAVGILFTLGSLGGLLATLFVRRLKNLFGSAKHLFIFTIFMSLATLAGFVLSKDPWFVAPLFILYWSLSYLFLFVSDIFVESYSENVTTGNTRGILLTIAGLGTMLAPLVAGRLSETPDGFTLVYLLAGGLIIISLLGMVIFGQDLKEPHFMRTNIIAGFRNFFANKDYVGVFSANFILQFFFSWMVIYTPIYLYQYIGFSWTQIGIIFSVMLLPFVLIEIPLGQLADRLLGEKEIMHTGIIIMSVSTLSLAFLFTPSVWLWIMALLLTRIGASAVQVSSDSYFFKKVDESNVSTIATYRITVPLAFMIGPLTGTILLGLPGFQFRWLYIALALLVLLAIPFLFRIRDTR